MMRQAVQISFVGHCLTSVTVPVAFHMLLVRTAVYCHRNMYSFLPEGVSVINALWGLAVTLDSEAGASCSWRSSPTLSWSPGRLKDGEMRLALVLAALKCFFYWTRVLVLSLWLEPTDIKARVEARRHFKKQHQTGRLLFWDGSRSHNKCTDLYK